MKITSIRKLLESVSPSDFPNLLGNTLNKVLLQAYRGVTSNWRRFVRTAELPDFKDKTLLRLTETDELVEVKPGGEYIGSGVSETKQTYKLRKFGRQFGILWETIRNDDLDALRRQPERFGRAAARSVDKFVIQTLLEGNANTYDGNPVFSAGHNNLATGTGSALGEASLSAGITAMKKQTDEKGNPLGIVPAFIIVPPDLEFTARKLLNSTLVPGSNNNDVNVLRGIVEVLVEPLLTSATAWYLAANPADVDTIEVGFLRGIGDQPQLFVKDPDARRVGGGDIDPLDGDFDHDEIQYKVRHVWGGAIPDFRGLYKAAGA